MLPAARMGLNFCVLPVRGRHKVTMKRSVIQLLAVAVIAGGAYLAWQALGQPAAQEETAVAASAVPVAVAEAETGIVSYTVEAVGTTLARESVELVAPVAGRVIAIHFEEGEEVERGRLLIELDRDREEAELREQQAMLSDVANQLERANRLLRSQNVSQARVDELRAAYAAAEARLAMIEAALRDREIRAPFDGVVGLRDVSPGAFVQPHQRLTTLDDISILRLDFSVPERFLSRVQPGLPVRAISAAFSGTTFEGRVSRVDTRVDPVTRSLRIQAELENADRRLRPGTFMSVSLQVGEKSDAILVPEAAVVSEGRSTYVFVIAGGRAERRSVVIGQRLHGQVEIAEGLAAGEMVATLGLQHLSDGAEIKIINPQAVGV